ncbi:MAG TPA: HAD family phosphatase [Candidatus Polarisedimenticolaceae bacterium]
MPRFDLVAFDVDGTLVEHPEEKTVWEVLNARFLGADDLNRERYAAYKAGRLSYAEWVTLDVGGWRDAGATRGSMLESLGPLRLVDGARESLDALKREGVRLAVISGTLDFLLDALFPDHPFDEVYCNRVVFDDAGRIDHWHATPFDMGGKAVALRAIASREGIPLARCAFVGDHANDLDAARLAGFAIAFNPKDAQLEAAAGAVVRSRDLRDVLPYLL